MPDTAVVVVPEEERQLRGLELALRAFDAEQRLAVAQFLDIPPESPALMPYLALCAGLNLSPVMGHVWLIPKTIKGRDGEEERKVYRPAIGRDGLLEKARQTKGKPGGFKGLRSNVVCERDTFEVSDDGNEVTIMHRFASKPTAFEAGVAPDKWRGRVIGAWAKCFIDGEPPVFYYADLREHGRLRHTWAWNDAAHKMRPLYHDPAGNGKVTFTEMSDGIRHRPVQEWEGAWSFLSTMILKAAQSYVLRIGLGVTGVVPVDELRSEDEYTNGPARETGPSIEHPGVIEEFAFDSLGAPEEVVERLTVAVQAANEGQPYSWPPAKCEMVMTGRTLEELVEIAEQIERENEARAQRAAGAGETEPAIHDAEVVEDNGPRASEMPADVKEKVDELRVRQRHLQEALESGDHDPGVITAELDQVEAQLRALGAL